MAERPVFEPVFDGPVLVRTHRVNFEWHPGMSATQKRKSVDSLHRAAKGLNGIDAILEVSSKSREEFGVALSAFNLTFETVKHRRTFSVECAYQGSKVFELGGPYVDLFGMTAREAKQDERLRSSGRLVGFRFFGSDWALEPQTAFYDWLYINALKKKPGVIDELLKYSAFTDIEFNPERQVNCQAYAVALFVSLYQRAMLPESLTKDLFLSMMKGRTVSNAAPDQTIQGALEI